MEPASTAVCSARTIDTLRTEASAALAAAGVGTVRLDADILLAAACGIDRTALYVRGTDAVSPRLEADFRALLARRIAREPLAYIVGRQEFWSLDFVVTSEVLIPRPETELLVELALARLTQEAGSSPPRLRLCDVGTGSGCIAIAMSRELPCAEVWALDTSRTALQVAAANARRHGVAERIRLIESDLFTAVWAQRFDAILANPPYVSDMELDGLQAEVRCEPRSALDGGADGLAIIQRLVHSASQHLVDGGWLLMEIGAQQGAAAAAMAHAASLREVSVRADYARLPRVLIARR